MFQTLTNLVTSLIKGVTRLFVAVKDNYVEYVDTVSEALVNISWGFLTTFSLFMVVYYCPVLLLVAFWLVVAAAIIGPLAMAGVKLYRVMT